MQKIGSTSNSEPYQLSNSADVKIESNSIYGCSVQVLHLEWRNSTGRLVKIRHLRIANRSRNINWGDYRSARGSFNGDNRNRDPAELQTLRKRRESGERMPLPTDLSYVSSNGPQAHMMMPVVGPLDRKCYGFLGLIMGFEISIGHKNIRKAYLPSPTFLGFELWIFSCKIHI